MSTEDQITDSGVILLDIGNTNLKWVWLQGEHPGEITIVPHRGEDIQELASREWSAIAAPRKVYISSVAGQSLESGLAEWISRNWGCDPIFIRSTAQACGVTNAYPEPERLGVDRWLTMIALHAQFPGPTCVVDCGTAVTIDVLGLNGQHLGGLILPGFGLMRQALEEYTSISFEPDTNYAGLLAVDTESAIAAGGVSAVAALVERIATHVAGEYDVTVDLVLTGGDAEILQQALTAPSWIETDLVLRGMVEIINDDVG